MTRFLLALLACAGIAASALPAKAAIVLPGSSVANAANAPLAQDVRWRHHRRHYHHPHA